MKALAKTHRHKTGAIDGLNLFFGALLGANLGMLQGLKLVHYLMMIGVLAGMVMGLRLVSTSEDRRRPIVVLLVYALLLATIVTLPGFRPAGLAIADLHKLVGTMGIWILLAFAIELSPTRDDETAV
jgi:hypothetical protein